MRSNIVRVVFALCETSLITLAFLPFACSHRGHPLCHFCDVRYVDDEDLHRHLRRDHFFCHYCDPLGLNQFYDSYEHLRDHFKKVSFLSTLFFE